MRNEQRVLQIILIFKFNVSFYCKITDKCNRSGF